MTVDWNAELLDQLDLHWTATLRPRLAGLTDDEDLWAPVDGCWTVRPTDAGRRRLRGLDGGDRNAR